MTDYNGLRDVIAGLEIFLRYGGRFVDAEHDVLYAGPEGDPSALHAEDIAKLEASGWHWNTEAESWAIFT